MTDSLPLDRIAQTCGNCKHFDGKTTPTGKWKKRMSGQCLAEVILGAVPMCYRIELHKSATWPEVNADKCVTWMARTH